MRKLLSLCVLVILTVACSEATSKAQYKYLAAKDDGIAVKVGDEVITNEQLMADLKVDLYKKEIEIFTLKMNKVNALIVERLMKSDPKSKGMTNDQYFEKYIASEAKVTKKDISKFMQAQGVPAEQQKNPRVKERVVQYLKSQNRKKALDIWLAKKTKKTGIEIYFQKPAAPKFEIELGKAPRAGGEKAKVTIVEFSDFQCPYCAKAASVINKVKKKYGDKIKVVFKHFPLTMHTHARSTAMASMCAHELSPKSFWKFHDEVFINKAPLGSEQLIKLGVERLKLNKEQYTKCVNEKKYAAHVEKDIQQGTKIGIRGTPSIYINGELFLETLNFDKYVEKIEEQLKKTSI